MPHNIAPVALLNIYTKEDADMFMDALRHLQQFVFVKKTHSFTDTLAKLLPYTLATSLETDMQKKNIATAGDSAKEAYCTSLMEQIAALPVVQVTLAFIPTRVFIKKMWTELTQRYQKPVLFDITCDKKIIAGLIIVHEGRYIDLSAKKKLGA